MRMEEEILAEQCGKGDDAARRELYERYAGHLMAICVRYTGDRTAAEDLLHDAFLKIFGAIGRFSYRGTGSLRAWLDRVTVNMAIEWLRSRKRMALTPLDESRPLPEEVEPEPSHMAAIPHSELLRMISELPEGYRVVFNLYCIEGFAHRDIARMLGINEKSSSSQLFRARALMAQKVREYIKSHGL